MDKEQVAEILTEIGTLLELKGENPVQDSRLRECRTYNRRPERTADKKLSPKIGSAKSKASAKRSRKKSPNSSPPAN